MPAGSTPFQKNNPNPNRNPKRNQPQTLIAAPNPPPPPNAILLLVLLLQPNHRRGETHSLKISGYSYIYVRVQKNMTRTTSAAIAAMSIVANTTTAAQVEPGPSQFTQSLPSTPFVRGGRGGGSPQPWEAVIRFPTPEQAAGGGCSSTRIRSFFKFLNSIRAKLNQKPNAHHSNTPWAPTRLLRWTLQFLFYFATYGTPAGRLQKSTTPRITENVD